MMMWQGAGGAGLALQANALPTRLGVGRATAGASVQKKKKIQRPGNGRTLIEDVLKNYNDEKSLLLSKFAAYKSEEVLNDLQRLLQVQHHLAVLSQQQNGLDQIADIILEYGLMTMHEGECLP